MSTACAALLRGVNVGGKTKISMADLANTLTGLGLTAVRTLLNSGNATFRAPSLDGLEARVERALAQDLGLVTKVLLRTGDELRAVLAAHPFPEKADNGSKMVVLFLSGPPTDDSVLDLDPGNIALGDRALYQWCPDGISKAPLVGPWVEKKWGLVATGRNWNTVTKLAALL